ncbi:MAG: hypothetical protein KDA28_13970 [Phycisphaerales bacterium]|nr:hypothetical protein [Phycisphaerales bacterium]
MAIRVTVMVFLGFGPIGVGLAQDTPPTDVAEVSPAERIAARKTTIGEDLARVTALVESVEGAPPEHLTREQGLLKRLDLLLQQQLALLTEQSESEASLEQMEGDLERTLSAGPSETPPYSMLLLDTVRDELRTLRGRIETVEAGVTAAADAREQARSAFEQAEVARRRAKEGGARDQQ